MRALEILFLRLYFPVMKIKRQLISVKAGRLTGGNVQSAHSESAAHSLNFSSTCFPFLTKTVTLTNAFGNNLNDCEILQELRNFFV